MHQNSASQGYASSLQSFMYESQDSDMSYQK